MIRPDDDNGYDYGDGHDAADDDDGGDDDEADDKMNIALNIGFCNSCQYCDRAYLSLQTYSIIVIAFMVSVKHIASSTGIVNVIAIFIVTVVLESSNKC